MKKITQKEKTKIINRAIKEFKDGLEPGEFEEMKKDQELYAIESDIDIILIDEYGATGEGTNYELMLERYTFDAIKKMQKGQRDPCDPYYDDAFQGYDGF